MIWSYCTFTFIQFTYEPASVHLLLFFLCIQQPDLLPCTNETESDRWPEGMNVEHLTDTQTEESGEEEKEAGGKQGGMRMRVDSDRLQLVITGVLSNGKASCL